MRAYNPASGTVTSVFGDENVIKTLFDADDIVSHNPFIILRAIYLAARYRIPIHEDLRDAIEKYASRLLEEYPVEQLQFAKQKIESVDKEVAQTLFQNYQLDTILDFGE